jgi:hypothetical protein
MRKKELNALVDLGLQIFANVWFSIRPPDRRFMLPFGSVKSLKSFVYINHAVRNTDIHCRNIAFSESLSLV